MHQINAIAAAPFPAGPLTPLHEVIEGKMKPLVVSNPVNLSPLGPDFLPWVIEQCELWVNEHKRLVPMNFDSPDISPSATLGFRALRALCTGLNSEEAGELHHALVAQL